MALPVEKDATSAVVRSQIRVSTYSTLVEVLFTDDSLLILLIDCTGERSESTADVNHVFGGNFHVFDLQSFSEQKGLF